MSCALCAIFHLQISYGYVKIRSPIARNVGISKQRIKTEGGSREYSKQSFRTIQKKKVMEDSKNSPPEESTV